MNDPSQVNGSVSYSLDPVGNRLSDQSTLGPIGSTSTTFNSDDQSQAETYDSSGDTISTGGNTYAYNSWLKLTSMNGGQVALTYNGLGQLVSKSANGITTQYLIDDLSPAGYPQVVEEIVGGQVARKYTYGLERISELQMVNNAPTASFYQYDGRGTVRMLTNSAGAVTDAYEYDAFGNMISSAGTTPNVYLYRGERYDSDLSLYYLRARWYNPVTGRFMTRDPYEGSIYDPASLHRYNYARANPANFIDPSGRAASSDYVYLGLNTLAKAVVLTATGEAIGCAYYALASATDLVGQHIGQDFTQLGLLWQGCEAEITVKQHIQGILTNLLFIGIGKGIGWLLEDAEAGLPCAECFAAGTPVHTDHGTISIERIKTGDKVWARDSITGKNELQTVTAIAPQHRDQLVELRIAGEKSPLRTTPVHPFRARRDASAAAHWIKAGDLKAGDLLETEEGRWVAIQSVTPIQGLAVVYNFTVDKDHDYFVGETGFLVHNANCGCGEDPLTWLEDPNLIGFTQDSIGNTIHLPDGSEIPLQGYINALQSGEINPGDVEPIRVFGGPDGSLWSIDNRRLYAARQAGVPANTRAATREEALRRKITTKNNGGLPCVRGR